MYAPLVVLYALSVVLALAFVWRFVHFFRGLRAGDHDVGAAER